MAVGGRPVIERNGLGRLGGLLRLFYRFFGGFLRHGPPLSEIVAKQMGDERRIGKPLKAAWPRRLFRTAAFALSFEYR